MSSQDDNYAYLDGSIIPKSEAKISCFDRGVTHGWAVYEGIRVYDGKILKLDEHTNRLYDSAKAACIKFPLSKEEFKKAVIDTVKANGYKNCHIRPWLSYGTKGDDPNLSIITVPRGSYDEMGKEKTAVVSPIRRTACDAIDSKIKTNSRLDLCLAGYDARRQGADLAIMLDKDGYVAEISMANIFLVKRGKIFTPFTTNALEGVTRELLMELLKKAGFNVEERNLTMKDLYVADEIFTCGTGEEINPIVMVDGRVIGDKKIGDITRKTIEMYIKFIDENSIPIY
jgi:branched-chain amino acid aminotransferase